MFGSPKKKAEKFFEEHQEILNPPSEFAGYEITDESRENLAKIAALLSNHLADEQEISFEDKLTRNQSKLV